MRSVAIHTFGAFDYLRPGNLKTIHEKILVALDPFHPIGPFHLTISLTVRSKDYYWILSRQHWKSLTSFNIGTAEKSTIRGIMRLF